MIPKICTDIFQKIFDKAETRELKPGGSDIEVTEENKEEYIKKLVEYRLTAGVKAQLAGLAYGFNEVVNINHLKDIEEMFKKLRSRIY